MNPAPDAAALASVNSSQNAMDIRSSSVRKEAISISLKKNLEQVKSVQRIVERSRTSAPRYGQVTVKKSRYIDESGQPKDRVRG